MKLMKKIVAMILTMMLLVPVCVNTVYAADGTLMFSDPSTKVGENVSVNLVINAGEAAIGDVDVTMSYDPTALEFVGGDEVESDGNGTLTYSHKGNGSEKELRTVLEFRALKEGTADITVTGHTAYLFSDETLTLSEGSSVVTIEVGADGITSIDPTEKGNTENKVSATDVKVDVNGVEYSFSEEFKDTDIPVGYGETLFTYDGAERKFVENENGVKLGYLVDSEGNAKFFLFDEEDATFKPFVEVYISEETAIILLDQVDNVNLPEQYQKADLTIGDYTFPAWQDMEHHGYYAIYALNTRTANKELYQYDTEDGTYQKMIVPKKTNEEKDDTSFIGKLKTTVYDNFIIFLAIAVLVFLILLIIVIVTSVKLYRRNVELDEYYDEYGIDEDEKVETKKAKKEKTIVEDDYLDDEYYDEEDDYYDDYLDDFEVGYDDYDDDFQVDHTKNLSRKSKRKEENLYDIDFIDL